MTRHIKSAPGSVVAIDLGNRETTFGRSLNSPLFEFFDCRAASGESPELAAIMGSPVLFRINIMAYAVKSGRWPVIGIVPLSPNELSHEEVFFKQDAISGAFSLYWTDFTTKESFSEKSSLEECMRFERAAVWDPDHAEDRLRDHYAGRPNKWVESLRPRL
jgi:Immunity protein 26